MGLLFLLLIGKNITHHLNGMRKKGSSKIQDPCSTLQKRLQGGLIFLVSLLANLLVSCFVENLMLRHCHFVFVCSWGIFELLSYLAWWNLDNVDDSWNLVMYVTCGIDEWILIWILWVLKSWNLMCRLDWTNLFLMSVEILLGGFIYAIALILSGSTSIPLWLTINPNIFLDVMPKVHIFGFNCNL